MSKDYDIVLTADEDGNIPSGSLPERFHGEIDYVIRQKGWTTTHQGRSMRGEATTQNDHLEITEDYWEAEIKLFGEDKELVKVEAPYGYRFDVENDMDLVEVNE